MLTVEFKAGCELCPGPRYKESSVTFVVSPTIVLTAPGFRGLQGTWNVTEETGYTRKLDNQEVILYRRSCGAAGKSWFESQETWL